MLTLKRARATSAAPRYFKPFCHEPSKQTYTDGGIYHNNPIKIADRERKLIWPNQQEEEPDIILSVGTLFSETKKEKRARTYAPKGIVSHMGHLSKMAHDHMHSSLDSEKTWREYLNVRAPTGENRKRYIRLNPRVPEPPPGLDETKKMQGLQATTRLLLGSDQQIKDLARRLVATCFYFDTDGDVKEEDDFNVERYEVTGQYAISIRMSVKA